MLTNATHVKGLVIRATDGELGTVDQFYFDDETWAIRYFTVDTGGWLGGRRVLISPYSVVHTDWQAKRLDVALTKKQVENSPDINTHKPVSRQHEAELLRVLRISLLLGWSLSVGPGVLPGRARLFQRLLPPKRWRTGSRKESHGFASAQCRSRHWLSHGGD